MATRSIHVRIADCPLCDQSHVYTLDIRDETEVLGIARRPETERRLDDEEITWVFVCLTTGQRFQATIVVPRAVLSDGDRIAAI